MANTAERRLTAPPPTDLDAAAARGLEDVRHTELGKLLIAARREFLEAEGHFLTPEELEREIAERRGGVRWDDED
ncbi:MAG: hypothetical protein H0U10_16485 [Chloroflexia bacterium]|nr:hypothetical protein [Chloroflexia bacterium]